MIAKPTPKTEDEVKAEIAALKAIKPTVRHFTAFHEDNWAAIDAQAKVLEDEMSQDAVYDEFEDMHTQEAAIEAAQWRDGEDTEGTPSSQWLPLVQGGTAEAEEEDDGDGEDDDEEDDEEEDEEPYV